MTEWNLSVRLTGQGSDLASTLRDSAKEAGKLTDRLNDAKQALTELRAAAANDITVRLDLDADHLRADVDNALRGAGSGQGLSVRLDVDGAHLRDDVTAALASASGQGLRVRLDLDADHLRDDVNNALTAAGAGQGLRIDLQLGNAMQLRRDVQNAVRWAAWGHRIEIPIGLADPMQLRRDVSNAVRWASMNQVINVRVRADTSGLGDLTNLLNPSGGGSSGGGGFGLAGLLPIATAAIPLIAGIAANLAPVAGMLVATGGAATAFGIALAGQIGPMTELAEAEQQYQDAVAEHGKSSMEAAQAQLAYQQKLAAMPQETQRAAVALSSLKETFKGWSDDMAGFTMEPVTKSFAVMEEVLPHLSPEVESFSGSLDRLMNVAGGAVASPGFDAFSEKVGELTDAKLDDFTDQVIHLLRVVSQGDADAGAIGEIMAYFRENGPEAREAVNAIGDAVSTLAQGAAQAGPTMLTLVTAAARLVASLPPELVAIILQTAAALKILQLAGAGVAVVAGGIARVRVAIASLAAASAAAGGGLAGLSAAFATLGTAAKASVIVAGIGLAVLAISKLSNIGEKAPPNVDKLTTSLGNLGRTGTATGYVAEQFGKDFGKLNDSINKVTNPSVVESVNNWGADITGGFLDGGDAAEEFAKTAGSADEALANLVRNGNADLAKAALASMMKGMSPENAKKFRGELGDYDQALADLKFEADLTADSMGIFGSAAAETSAKLNAQKTAADGLKAAILDLNQVNRDAHDAETKFQAGLDALDEAFKKNGSTLNAHTEAGRANRDAMSQAAGAQDQMIATGLAAGSSMDAMVQKSGSLRTEMMKLAVDAFDGNRVKAQAYVNTLLGTPKEVKTLIKAERADAIRGLEEVRAEIQATPGAKKVTVSTLNAAAIAALEAVGLKTKQLPDGRTAVYTANGKSLGSIGAVSSALNNLDGKTANTYTTHTVRTINEIITKSKTYRSVHDIVGKADGGIVTAYADGGIRADRVAFFAGGGEPGDRPNQHMAQIAPAGSYRVWGERETEGEGYVPFRRSARPRSRAITEEIVRRLGGDPQTIQWNADGNITDWRYDPQSGSLYSPSDAGSAGNKTGKRKVKVKGKWTTKEYEYFDLRAVEKKLKSASKATAAWNKDLEKVADRVGGDVAEALASMGKEGEKLADKMARGSTKYINEMAAALRGLKKEAKASLTDYTRQLSGANKLNKEFSDDLATLAARGYGDLAKQLAAQNDKAAQQLADAAVKDSGKAKSANAAAKTANNALTGDQIEQLVSIIAAITKSSTGIHDVAATTGLGEDEIVATATKATSQIKSALGGRAARFLTDLSKAQKGLAFANGGIRSGIYATRGGAVTFAEPSTGGEAYIPLGADKRRHALPVLSDVAGRFGLGLRDASEGRVVIIRQQAPLVGNQTWHVTSGGSAAETARQIDADNGYQLRRLARGGVRARG